mmetsp:Transcript_7579/g.23415  ORF Transcript_7579/g.23415 Transcript_7579/m.23415 type:complete len:148 (+) Transcript_7579:42-485(+)
MMSYRRSGNRAQGPAWWVARVLERRLPFELAAEVAAAYGRDLVARRLGRIHAEILREPPCLALTETFFCVDTDYEWAYRLPSLIDAEDDGDDDSAAPPHGDHRDDARQALQCRVSAARFRLAIHWRHWLRFQSYSEAFLAFGSSFAL